METPRLCGAPPSQRVRPALPIEMFMWSGLDTAPTVPMQRPCDQALLAGIEPQDHVFLVAADDLGIGAGRARELAALADLHLHVMDDGADRHVADRHGIAGLHVDMLAGNDGVALAEPLRRQDVGELAVART